MRKHTNEEILGVVEKEGLEYTVTSYLSPERVEDKKMKGNNHKCKKNAREPRRTP